MADALDCIARSLGVGIDTSSLERLLASATCTATTLNTLVLTAYNCLSFPHPIATIGCINGIAKLISCGLVNCRPPEDCFGSIEFGGAVSDSWSTSCPSVHRRGRHARYYTFTLATSARIEINLISTVDTYLYLLKGEGSNGQVVASDNDGGPGSDSRISRSLSPGTYTVEATTNRSGATGRFELTLRR